jgi:hypothetical protein
LDLESKPDSQFQNEVVFSAVAKTASWGISAACLANSLFAFL